MKMYNHFEYAERLATRLRDISHSPTHHRFFRALGIEDLFEFDEQLSSVDGFVLIAVDGYESDSGYNHADGYEDARHYGFIVARNVVGDRPESRCDAMAQSRCICKQIRNALLADMNLAGYLNPNTQLNGIGPIGENFYGCLLSIDINEMDDLSIDPMMWNPVR